MDETTNGASQLNDPQQMTLMGGELAPVVAPTSKTGSYRVLARKYRPLTFDDLIGQEAMIRTLSNAFDTGRIPQAWMLTGVRGVGKTTTARILARALNYQLPDGAGGPTVHMPVLGLHCEAIMESRHVDVLEMDAASHTGVEDVRQIIDGIRYSPVSARYKVYIIDEVHMLSEKAFNAFLKTLEEPPPHAKFVFATTEIRKVPITILSRCQRFDLRRIDSDKLVAHLTNICEKEHVKAEPDALSAIALAAEGSARDSLSLLDQAIAHGGGFIAADTVRDMLGLADRAQVIDLFEAVMSGDMQRSFASLRHQYGAGADPAVILSDLASFVHLVTRFKLVPDAAKDPSVTEVERVRGLELAGKLSIRVLSRAWQIILKGLPEVQIASRPIAAAEMILVRLAYVADLPTPDEALRALRSGGFANSGAGGVMGAASMSAAPQAPAISQSIQAVPAEPQVNQPPLHIASHLGGAGAVTATAQSLPEIAGTGLRLRRFDDIVAYAGEQREISLKVALENDVHLVRFEEGHIEFRLAEGGNQKLPNELTRALQEWTGRRWIVALSSEEGAETLRESRERKASELRMNATAHPLVQAVLSRFPGAQIIDVRDRNNDHLPDITVSDQIDLDENDEAGAND